MNQLTKKKTVSFFLYLYCLKLHNLLLIIFDRKFKKKTYNVIIYLDKFNNTRLFNNLMRHTGCVPNASRNKNEFLEFKIDYHTQQYNKNNQIIRFY